MDLKQLSKHDKYILYVLYKFLGKIKGIVVKNKEAATVLENFEKIAELGFLGPWRTQIFSKFFKKVVAS